MKITRVATTLLTGPSTNDRFLREARGPRSGAFIEIHTDAGVTGLGETYAGYFCPEVVPSIAGAALDTHYAYPLPPEHPLWRYPNVILTPHVSGSSLSPHVRTRVWDIFASNVERYVTGAPMLNRLTATQLNGA
jgi:hypothetical protein